MNERIRYFSKQAGFYVSGDKIYIPDPHTEEITDSQKKFAELILDRVIDIVDSHHNIVVRPENHILIEHIKKAISSHFDIQ